VPICTRPATTFALPLNPPYSPLLHSWCIAAWEATQWSKINIIFINTVRFKFMGETLASGLLLGVMFGKTFMIISIFQFLLIISPNTVFLMLFWTSDARASKLCWHGWCLPFWVQNNAKDFIACCISVTSNKEVALDKNLQMKSTHCSELLMLGVSEFCQHLGFQLRLRQQQWFFSLLYCLSWCYQ